MVFVTARSAILSMSVTSVESLLVRSESTMPVGNVTDAVFESVPLAAGDTVAVTLNVTVLAAGMSIISLIEPKPDAALHDAAPVAAQVQLAPINAAGNESITWMRSICDGPGLVTTIVYVVEVPATIVATPSDLTIDTSPSPLTMVVSMAMLSALLGSVTPTGASTVAVLVTTPIWLIAIVASITNVADSPMARSTVVAMSPPPAADAHDELGKALHVHVTADNPAGITSVTVAPTTADGPLLVTTMA